MIGIYKIENLINGKVYIGQSINIEARWKQHKNLINHKTPLYLAFQKYGIDNFSFSILEECKEFELNQKEKEYIIKYNSFTGFKDSKGYNLTLGGEGNNLISEEQYNQMAELWEKGKSIIEICQLLNCSHETIRLFLKFNVPSYSIEESNLRGKKISNQNMTTCKEIDCYDLYGNYLASYESIREASRILSIDRKDIINSCKGKRSRVKEYRFTYSTENKNLLFLGKSYNDYVVILTKNNKQQLFFPSLSHAAKFLSIKIDILKEKNNTYYKDYFIEIKKY